MWGGAVCGVFQGTSTFSIFLIFPFKHSVLFLLYTLSNWPANILPHPYWILQIRYVTYPHTETDL